MALIYKEAVSVLAILLTFIAFIPYIRSIHRGETKPHAFTWIIWASVTFIVFLAQLADKGGAGAWPIGISGLITLYVAFLAYQKKSDIVITKKDWVFLIAAMSALPFWFFTDNPLWAVVILTAVDLTGFAPTFRKTWHHPYEEQLIFYFLMASRNTLSIIALENYSLTTLLFPAATALACILLILTALKRRQRYNQ